MSTPEARAEAQPHDPLDDQRDPLPADPPESPPSDGGHAAVGAGSEEGSEDSSKAASEAASPPYAIGASVRLNARPSYLKTADPMPMLRPPDLVDAGEVGQVVAQKALDQLAVRFRRGTFLLAADQLAAAGEVDRPSG